MRTRSRRAATTWRDKVWGKAGPPGRSARAAAGAQERLPAPRLGWTPERVRQAALMTAEGQNPAHVAAAVGLSADQVETKMRELGYLRRPRRAPARTAQFDWTPDRTAHAVRRWGEGALASVIAAELTLQAGSEVTKSAVIGKMTRLGLTGRNAAPDAPQRKSGRPVGFRKGRDFALT